MDNKVKAITCLLFILIFQLSNAQEQYGHFTTLKDFEVERTQEIFGITGFTYENGSLWCVTNAGTLVKMDTTNGTQIEHRQMSIHNETNWFYGAVDLSEDTLWVVATTKIFPLDTLGQQIGEPIRFPHFDTPFTWNIPGLVKEDNKFWVLQNMPYILFQIDRNGNLLGQYPNRFRGTTGYIELLGISVGENCFWSIELTWQNSYRVRKLSIPDPRPMPEFFKIEWGISKLSIGATARSKMEQSKGFMDLNMIRAITRFGLVRESGSYSVLKIPMNVYSN